MGGLGGWVDVVSVLFLLLFRLVSEVPDPTRTLFRCLDVQVFGKGSLVASKHIILFRRTAYSGSE